MIKSLQLKSHRFKNVGRYILYDRPLVDHHALTSLTMAIPQHRLLVFASYKL